MNSGQAKHIGKHRHRHRVKDIRVRETETETEIQRDREIGTELLRDTVIPVTWQCGDGPARAPRLLA